MATNNVRTFTLTQLFDGDVSLIIPDLQRDYCWGTAPDEGTADNRASHFPLSIGQASTFVAGVVYLYYTRRPYMLGLLYGYYDAHDPRRMYLIDGQQPVTTLYLLLGMLYRRTPTAELRKLLISDYALIDDHRPKLEYQTRSEAQYFMSDLVTRFFLDRDGRLSQLEKSTWYYSSYSSDPTVQSFISAIRLIDQVLEQADARWEDWDWDAFARFVARELTFAFCDLGDRATAERMFVTLNTTGVPLTFAQNLRALSIAWDKDTDALPEKWNEIEDWFWAHPITGYGLDDFLQLYLNSLENISEFEFDDLYSFFRALKRVFQSVTSRQWCYVPVVTSDLCMALLPSLAYVEKWGERATDDDIARVWEYFANITRYQRPSSADADDAVLMVEHMPQPDLLSWLSVKRVPQRLLNAEEKLKLQFIKRHEDHRSEVERELWRAQAHPMLNGRLSAVLDWCEGQDALCHLRHYVNAIYAIWSGDINLNRKLDVVRRALLAQRHHDYPIVRRGDTVLSLCWNDYDWQRLMVSAPGLIRQLIDRCDGFSHEQLAASFSRMIDRFADRTYPYYFIIKSGDLLRECRKRQLLHPCSPFLGMYDYECGYVRWFVDQQELPVEPKRWRTWRAYGAKCLYADHLHSNLAIDLYFHPVDKKKYRIEIFMREDENARKREDLRPLLDELGLRCAYDRQRRRYWMTVNSPFAVLRQLIDSDT